LKWKCVQYFERNGFISFYLKILRVSIETQDRRQNIGFKYGLVGSYHIYSDLEQFKEWLYAKGHYGLYFYPLYLNADSKALRNWKIFLKALSKRLQKLTIMAIKIFKFCYNKRLISHF